MAGSLKDQNKLALFAVMIANLAIFYLAVQTDAVFTLDWIKLAKGAGEAMPAGLGLALVGVLNAQLSSDAKARIVFGRWHNPLPGSEAFSFYATKDSRIDIDALAREHGPLPTDPEQQNRLWYRLYKSVEEDPSVQNAHREFLFTRDYTCLSLMMALFLGFAGFFQIDPAGNYLIYLGLLIVQFIVSWRAARNHGRRFVTNVLAVKAAEY